ncbi:hypothetical protein M758_1G089900 [Ceratodon purpureus]|nr:hypothetical protein M758_1G089900 [Ceratodon purpureus]
MAGRPRGRHSTGSERPQSSNQRSSGFTAIPDKYSSTDEALQALHEAGLETSNLIVGIDFTKSNEWTGKRSFDGRCLHDTGGEPNPYEKALGILMRTLYPFDADKLIPCYGFGDFKTQARHVFSFYPNHRPCKGQDEVVARYRAIVSELTFFGPTSFAPIINAGVDIVEESNGQHHILVIIADGQIEPSEEQATVDSIVNASHHPLSIVLVGVGDGPWDKMEEFDDKLPKRKFDNFQFVNFTNILQEAVPEIMKESKFALAALMEIPDQYREMRKLGLLGVRTGTHSGVKPLPGPAILVHLLEQVLPVRHMSLDEINIALGPEKDRKRIGSGAFGDVFQGVLPENNAKIAVKQLSLDVQNVEQDSVLKDSFKAELTALGQAHHKNLILLYGFCATGEKLMLVYEFMQNLSLEGHIYVVDSHNQLWSKPNLNWAQRLHVISGIARALEYLHHGTNKPILHLDIKPANILLNEDFEPKLADFGLAKIMPEANIRTIIQSQAAGTPGYIAPELYKPLMMFGRGGDIDIVASTKSDVYSFGCMLNEITRGRRNYQGRQRRGAQFFFPAWASEVGSREKKAELDSSIAGFHESTAIKLIDIALRCVKHERGDRPSMKDVVKMLEALTPT